jgi:Lon protease-like protein
MDHRLGQIENVPLFPLSDVVFFPKTYLPLHVFEERYRLMVRESLDGPGRIAVPLLRSGWENDYEGRPPVHRTMTVGTIQRYVPLPDGRFDVLLLGEYRGHCLDETRDKIYRVGQIQAVPEVPPPGEHVEAEERSLLLELYDAFLETKGARETRTRLQDEDLSFETLVNAVPSLLKLSVDARQRMLEINSLVARGIESRRLLSEALQKT